MKEHVWYCTDTRNEYRAQVVRTGPRAGQWQFIRTATGEVLKQEPVTLSYGARFGPDVADADEWLRMAYAATPKEHWGK
jgi:hypothetical protein